MSNKMHVPNFFILGATKSGTTSLHHYLNQHPEIYLPQEKEVQFFIDDQLFSRGLEYYRKYYFPGVEKEQVVGEATPLYFHRPDIVIPRLHSTLSSDSLKFIIVLRDPVKRAWSHYLHMCRLGEETLSFEEAMEVEPERMKDQPIGWYSYFSDGLYATLLSQWFKSFDRDQFLVLTFDELSVDLNNTLRRIFSFLEVDSSMTIADLSVKNEAGMARSRWLMAMLMGRFPGARLFKALFPLHFRRKIGMQLRHLNTKRPDNPEELDAVMEIKLRKRYASDINHLESLLQRSLSSWKQE